MLKNVIFTKVLNFKYAYFFVRDLRLFPIKTVSRLSSCACEHQKVLLNRWHIIHHERNG